MSKVGAALGTGLAIVLALVFCLSLAPSLLLGNLSAVVFDSGQMTTLLTDSFVRSGALSAYAVSVLSEKVGGGTPITSHLTQADWANLVNAVFPATWQQRQIAANLDAFYAWLDSSDPVPALSLVLTEIKAGLQGDGAKRMADALVNSWPPCSTQQIQAYASATSFQGALPVCRPPEPYLGELQQGLAQEIKRQASQLPESLSLTQPASAGSGAEALKMELRLLRDFGPVAWLIPLALLLLELACAVRSLRGLLGWTGVPLVVGSLLGVLLVLVVNVLRSRGLISLVAVPAALRAAAGSLLGLLLRSLFGRLLIECAALLFLGFVLVVLSLALHSKPQPAVAAGTLAGTPPLGPAPSQAIPPSEVPSSAAPALGKGTVILPKEPPPEEPTAERKPPRGIFG
jgi:hypothetical protein